VPIAATVLTLVMCAAAIVAFRHGWTRLYPLFKVLASAGFVAVAFSGGVPGDAWRVTLALGLIVAVAGDALLSRRETWTFVVGMAAFLVMHLCYTAGFLTRGAEPSTLAIAFAAFVAMTGLVWRWGGASVPGRLRPAIAAYMGVLAVSLAAGAATGLARPGTALAVGVLLVGLSDIAVLRERFMTPGPANKVIGLPMYYTGQLMIAWAVIASV